MTRLTSMLCGSRLAVLVALLGMPLAYAAETPQEAEAAEPAIEQKSEDRPDLPTLAEVLGAEDGAEVERLTERCLPTRRIRSHRILDQQHIVFRVSRREQYLVRFPRRCIGLRRGDPITMSATAGRLCRLDTIRPLQRTGFGFNPGAQCLIPGFQRVTPEQVDYLVEALKRRGTANRAG
ncbi:MAG: DUF6491 family protein [Pseudomonadota bacterium]